MMKTIESFNVAPNGAIELKFTDGEVLGEFPAVLDGDMFTAFRPMTQEEVMPHLMTTLAGAVVSLSIRLRALEDEMPAASRRAGTGARLTQAQALMASFLTTPDGEMKTTAQRSNERVIELGRIHGTELPEYVLPRYVGEEEAKRLLECASTNRPYHSKKGDDYSDPAFDSVD